MQIIKIKNLNLKKIQNYLNKKKIFIKNKNNYFKIIKSKIIFSKNTSNFKVAQIIKIHKKKQIKLVSTNNIIKMTNLNKINNQTKKIKKNKIN